MAYYDERLEQLQQQIFRLRQAESQLTELRAQRDELSARLRDLEYCKRAEQADVDRLEGRTLAAFFCYLTGRRDEKLDKERQEAYAAAVKCDAAARSLDAVEQDIQRLEQEQRRLRDCEARYRQALDEKAAALKAAGGPAGAELLALEQRLALLAAQRREMQEAQTAGRRALELTEDILRSLESAEGWGTWDLIGGGLVTDMVKHSRLDDAQEQVEHLQIALRRFKMELADVTIQADLQVSVDGFLRFADYFFDGLFADWAVLDRIKQSSAQVRHTRTQIEEVLARLARLDEAAAQEQAQKQYRLDELVRSASL